MIEGQVESVMRLHGLAVDLRDAYVREEMAHSEAAERNHETRADKCKLLLKVRRAGLDLGDVGVPVGWWSAFHHVGDEDPVPTEPYAIEQLIQVLAGPPNEGESKLVLPGARPLSKEEDPSIGGPGSRDRLDPLLMELAPGARQDLRGKGTQIVVSSADGPLTFHVCQLRRPTDAVPPSFRDNFRTCPD